MRRWFDSSGEEFLASVWSAFKILTGKPTEKRPLGRPRPRWEDNIRMHLAKMRVIGLIRLRIGNIGKTL